MTAIIHRLAPLVAGTVHEDRIVVDSGCIYAAFTGKVRLERPGQVVATLGTIADGVEHLARAYHAATHGFEVSA